MIRIWWHTVIIKSRFFHRLVWVYQWPKKSNDFFFHRKKTIIVKKIYFFVHQLISMPDRGKSHTPNPNKKKTLKNHIKNPLNRLKFHVQSLHFIDHPEKTYLDLNQIFLPLKMINLYWIWDQLLNLDIISHISLSKTKKRKKNKTFNWSSWKTSVNSI